MKTSILFILLSLIAYGCGDSRTSASLRSPDDVKAKTDTFTVGTTTIQNVYDSLGLWNSSGVINTYGNADIRNDEYVVYWTNDGGQTRLDFVFTCDAGFPNCKDATSADLEHAKLLFSAASHTD